MSRADDFKRGLINRRRILGNDWVDRSLAGANGFNADFQSLITRHVWHDIWGRPGLPDKTRRLMVLSMMVALGRYDEFALHARAALEADVSLDELNELLLQAAVYCGVPAANSAFHTAQAVLRELGRLPAAGVAPELHAASSGDGPWLVVLAHALGCDLHMWDEVATLLQAAGLAVLRYDARGHGRSPTLPGPFDIGRMADDAERLVTKHLGATGGRSVMFVGLSMGGMVAQALAARRPAWLTRVVIANSASHYDDAAQNMWRQRIDTVEREGMEAMADGAMQRWFTPEFRAAQAERVARLRATLCGCDRRGYIEACRAVAGIDLLGGLAQVDCPALVIAGTRDEATPPSMSQAMVAALRSSARYAELPTAHLSAVEAPQAFADLLIDFARDR
jgi:3-oxoadipate enol-lactonase